MLASLNSLKVAGIQERNKMSIKAPTAVFLVFLASCTLLAGTAFAGSCVDQGCHASQLSFKYLHGPLAAEELGHKQQLEFLYTEVAFPQTDGG